MTLLRFLVRYSPAMVIWTSAAALLSGACNTGLLVLITSALNRHGNLGTALVVAFCALALGRAPPLPMG